MAARKGAPVRDANSAEAARGKASSGMHKDRIALVLLDRDGVLCDVDAVGILNLSMFKLVPGLVRSLKRLNGENFRVGIVTNQPCIAEGRCSIEDLDRMGAIIREKAAEAGIEPRNFVIKICAHGKDSDCDCRKPKTGLIRQVVKHFRLDPKLVHFYLVGDMMREIQTLDNYYDEALRPAGINKKAKTTILLNWKHGRDKGHISEEFRRLATPDYEVRSLDAALRRIQDREKSR